MKINKIYNENCLDTMKRMDDNYIDLTVTSPPYDGMRTYKGYSFDFKPIAKELYRVTKEGGVVVWVVGDAVIDGSETGTSFRQALYFKEIGFRLHDTMIYQKTGIPFPGNVRYNQMFEYMFVFSKGKPNCFNPILKKNKCAGSVKPNGAMYRQKDGSFKKNNVKKIKEYGVEGNVWVISGGMNKSTKDKIAFKHPAIFPEELATKHIKSWSNKGDLVYDCFMGSGTVAKCAMLLDRNYIGSEMSQEYCDIIKERLKSLNNFGQFFGER